MSVTTVLLDQLAAARRAGGDFGQAWDSAVTVALADVHGEERAFWQAVLRQTCSDWHQAWARRPARHLDFAMHMLADDD